MEKSQAYVSNPLTGIIFGLKDLHVKIKQSDTLHFKTTIWVPSGESSYTNLRPICYRHSKGALLVFNRENYETLKKLPAWISELDNSVPKIPRVLVGVTVANEHPIGTLEVTRSDAEQFAMDYKIPYFEVTLQKGNHQRDASYQQHIDAPFLKLLDMILLKEDCVRKKLSYEWSNGNLELSGKYDF